MHVGQMLLNVAFIQRTLQAAGSSRSWGSALDVCCSPVSPGPYRKEGAKFAELTPSTDAFNAL